ncbi:MAG: hypothetical protein LKH78_05860 [Weizmannia coagulans]|nr:hypothetical protein [Heyndrickxia coagulans]
MQEGMQAWYQRNAMGNPGSWEKPGEQLKPGKREDVEKNTLKIGVM